MKRKRPRESTATDDIDGSINLYFFLLQYYFELYLLGSDVEYSTTMFQDFAAYNSFKEV